MRLHTYKFTDFANLEEEFVWNLGGWMLSLRYHKSQSPENEFARILQAMYIARTAHDKPAYLIFPPFGKGVNVLREMKD